MTLLRAPGEIHVKMRGLEKPIFAVIAAVQTNPVDRPVAEQQFLCGVALEGDAGHRRVL
jgi:hypothetical protein